MLILAASFSNAPEDVLEVQVETHSHLKMMGFGTFKYQLHHRWGTRRYSQSFKTWSPAILSLKLPSAKKSHTKKVQAKMWGG